MYKNIENKIHKINVKICLPYCNSLLLFIDLFISYVTLHIDHDFSS